MLDRSTDEKRLHKWMKLRADRQNHICIALYVRDFVADFCNTKQATIKPCHDQALPHSSHATLKPCHNHVMAYSNHATIKPCHNQPTPQSSHATFKLRALFLTAVCIPVFATDVLFFFYIALFFNNHMLTSGDNQTS